MGKSLIRFLGKVFYSDEYDFGICENCEKEVIWGSNYCNWCGSELEMKQEIGNWTRQKDQYFDGHYFCTVCHTGEKYNEEKNLPKTCPYCNAIMRSDIIIE